MPNKRNRKNCINFALYDHINEGRYAVKWSEATCKGGAFLCSGVNCGLFEIKDMQKFSSVK